MNTSVLPRACAPKQNFEQLLVPPRSPALAFLNIGVWGHSKEMAYEHSMDRTTSSNFRCCKMSNDLAFLGTVTQVTGKRVRMCIQASGDHCEILLQSELDTATVKTSSLRVYHS